MLSFLGGEVKGLDMTYPEPSALQRQSWEPTVLLPFLLSSFFPPSAALLSFLSLPSILPGTSGKHYTAEDVILHASLSDVISDRMLSSAESQKGLSLKTPQT